MTISTLSVVVTTAISNVMLGLPNPVDSHGWALRVRGHSQVGPYLAGEAPSLPRFEVVLINQSSSTRPYPPLRDAWRCGDLQVSMVWDKDKGQVVHSWFRPLNWRLGDLHAYLRPGHFDSAGFALVDFGYLQLPGVGEYEARVVLRTPRGTIYSPTWKFHVVDVSPADVLDSQTIPNEGARAKRDWDDQEKLTVQQVRLGGRVYLVLRKFYGEKLGGAVSYAVRLRQLPGKVKLSVEGEYGDKPTPITIRLKDDTAPTGTTTLVISPFGGMWDDGSWRIAPAPRPLNP